MDGIRICKRRSVAITGAVCACGFVATVAWAAPPFVRITHSDGPGGTFDIAPSGRIVTMIGDELRIERTPRSGVYVTVGALPPGSISMFGASFVRVSPTGAHVAVGDNNFGDGFVYIIETETLDGGLIDADVFAFENFEGVWTDDVTLAVSYSNPVSFSGEVAMLDIVSGRIDLVALIDGSAGGVGSHPSGDVFIGNGFDFAPGGSETGEIRAFAAATVDAIRMGQREPLEFATEGRFIVDLLSAGSLVFDGVGTLLVGGGDLFGGSGDFGYFALVDPVAIDDARSGVGEVEATDVFRADPEAADASTYVGRFDFSSDEWVVMAFGFNTAFRYTPTDRGLLPSATPASDQTPDTVSMVEP